MYARLVVLDRFVPRQDLLQLLVHVLQGPIQSHQRQYVPLVSLENTQLQHLQSVRVVRRVTTRVAQAQQHALAVYLGPTWPPRVPHHRPRAQAV